MLHILRTILLICIYIGTGSNAFAEPPSLSDFTAADASASFSLSTDGKYIALLRASEAANPHIEILEARTGEVVKRISHETLRFWNVKWYDNTRLLISASWPGDARSVNRKSQTGEKVTILNVKNYGYSRLFIVDFDGSNFTKLVQTDSRLFDTYQHISTSDVLDVLKNDPDHLLVNVWQKKELAIYKINLKTGQAERIETGDWRTTGWLTNRNGVPVIRFDSYSSGRVVGVSAREPGNEDWSEIIRLRDKDFKDFQPLLATDDPNVFIAIARQAGEDKTGVYEYDIAQKRIGKKIFDNKDFDIDSVVFDANRQAVGYGYISDRLNYVFESPAYSKAFATLKSRVNADENIHVLDIAADQKTWLVLLTSPHNPGTYHYFNAETSQLTKYANLKNRISRADLGKTEIVRYKASDGLELTGYFTSPPDAEDGSAPLIVMPHGGPEVRDSYEYDTFAQFLASRGYSVFQPNFRGSGGYGKAFAAMGYGQWGGLMQDDITDGVKFLQETGRVTNPDMCIMGISYGGYAALMGAVKTPDMYRCAVSINGVSDLTAMVKYDKLTFGKKSAVYEYVLKTIGDPTADKARIIATSPSENTDAIQIPVLLMHGDEDEVVPVKQSRKLKKQMEKSGVEVEYLELPGTDHSLTNPGALAATLYTLENFLKQELPVEE